MLPLTRSNRLLELLLFWLLPAWFLPPPAGPSYLARCGCLSPPELPAAAPSSTSRAARFMPDTAAPNTWRPPPPSGAAGLEGTPFRSEWAGPLRGAGAAEADEVEVEAG